MREDEQLSYSFRMLLVFRDCISVSILVGRFSLVGPRTIHKHLDGKPERQRHRNPERIPLKELTSKKAGTPWSRSSRAIKLHSLHETALLV